MVFFIVSVHAIQVGAFPAGDFFHHIFGEKAFPERRNILRCLVVLVGGTYADADHAECGELYSIHRGCDY